MALTDKQLESYRKSINGSEVKRCREHLRAIAGTVRYNILVLLAQSPDGLTVSELAQVFKFSVSRVSHQLRILRKYNLVTIERAGKSMVYRVAPCPKGDCANCPLRLFCPEYGRR
jgi:DNA-binding transcriptional ArsR family regulator